MKVLQFHRMGKVKINIVHRADDRLSSDDDDVYAQMRRNAREAEGSMEM